MEIILLIMGVHHPLRVAEHGNLDAGIIDLDITETAEGSKQFA